MVSLFIDLAEREYVPLTDTTWPSSHIAFAETILDAWVKKLAVSIPSPLGHVEHDSMPLI
jgi:hypothetical protein